MPDLQIREAKIAELLNGLTGEQVTEIGVGVVARGLFRHSEDRGKAAAAAMADSVSSTFTSIHIDMLRASLKKEPVDMASPND